MRNWITVLPAIAAAAALLFTVPAAATAADQAQTRTMDQVQMYSVNDSGMATSQAGQYREAVMYQQQTANMGSDCKVQAGEPQEMKLERGDTLRTKTGGGSTGSSGGDSKK